MANTTHLKPCLELDGMSLSCDELYRLQAGDIDICLSSGAIQRVVDGRGVVEAALAGGQVCYGINTGFGLFSNVVIPPHQLAELQANLIRSHAAGTGEPLSPARTRALLALRINVLAKGHSGISLKVAQQMCAAFNAGCLPQVPAKGTVGASGDLAPLSHLALGLMGEGPMWDLSTGIPSKALAATVLDKAGLQPIVLTAKEGLAMINGTQLIASLGAEAVVRADNVQKCADVACALTLEVLRGTVAAYHPLIHRTRPHHGQQMVASRIRHLLQPDHPSEIFQSHQYKDKVQDAYSLRCAPQVHGVTIDTIDFVRHVLDTELNSATDNPMVFTKEQVEAGEPMGFVYDGTRGRSVPPAKGLRRGRGGKLTETPADASDIGDLDTAKREIRALREALSKDFSMSKSSNATAYSSKEGHLIVSGGNFHGEYPAKALDFLAIGVHELAAISERRIERMCNPSISGLPAFLVAEGGLNSGFMIAHCTAAALVSENKVLCHPSSVDSISTSGSKEDHVSMGGWAARKCLEVVEHVETVVAIELLAACQGIEFHRPHKTTAALEAVHALVRRQVRPWDKDRMMFPDIAAVVELIRNGTVWRTVEPFLPKPQAKL